MVGAEQVQSAALPPSSWESVSVGQKDVGSETKTRGTYLLLGAGIIGVFSILLYFIISLM